MQFSLAALALALLTASATAAPRPQGAPANTCPVPCDPTQASSCDATATCTVIGAAPVCACRAGFRAEGPADDPKNARLPVPGQDFRVIVPPGTACNTPCGDAGLGAQACTEVPKRDQCSAPAPGGKL